MHSEFLNLLGGIAIAAIGFLGKRYTDNITAKTAKAAKDGELELEWVRELRAEIAELRGQVARLEERLNHKDNVVSSFADFLNELSAFVHYGRVGNYPTPPEIGAEHYNRARWLAIKRLHDDKMKENE